MAKHLGISACGASAATAGRSEIPVLDSPRQRARTASAAAIQGEPRRAR